MQNSYKTLEDLTKDILENSKTTMFSLTHADAVTAAEAVYPSYKAAVGLSEEYRDRLDQIDEKALHSGSVGTMTAMTEIHYLASR
jgi:hypothetical protein